MSCSPAELISVSIEQFKFQFNQLYLQTVKKSNHLPYAYFQNENKIILIELYHKNDKENEDRKRIEENFK
jgi:hypothetical protein